jgi:hypothetical protein
MRRPDDEASDRDFVSRLNLDDVAEPSRLDEPPQPARKDDRDVTRQSRERGEVEVVIVSVRDEHGVDVDGLRRPACPE